MKKGIFVAVMSLIAVGAIVVNAEATSVTVYNGSGTAISDGSATGERTGQANIIGAGSQQLTVTAKLTNSLNVAIDGSYFGYAINKAGTYQAPAFGVTPKSSSANNVTMVIKGSKLKSGSKELDTSYGVGDVNNDTQPPGTYDSVTKNTSITKSLTPSSDGSKKYYIWNKITVKSGDIPSVDTENYTDTAVTVTISQST
ncbi:MAG: hypothetical protein AABZ27_00430 [Candidatus Omnitrophota bacterium]